ncbi:hypothetical protein ERJ75_001825800 [Trypanosoma vivax]|uniref:Uncharacterized protein n=1 Tax=Trypanosoma vivax (strain Y486) TaxID=1055687 RepID=G0U8Z0_TRYVY|nr:hypothetical protein TRVL_03477 [Trypanosoma vivax]KAH8603510.1 hypothetical protein ERJ75_001825800 [Trypanosoma vivax]CCC54072.1 conserved hypothetical protein [Trypanosoma vivax Y486]
MAALRGIRSRQQVDKFCAVGCEVLNEQSWVSCSEWMRVLEKLESARCDGAILPSFKTLQANAVCEAARHYHTVHMKGASLVPLPMSLWEKWRVGLISFLEDFSAAEGKVEREKAQVEEFCRRLLGQWREQFVVVFWGSVSSATLRLESLITHVSLEAAPCSPEDADVGIGSSAVGDEEQASDGGPEESVDQCVVRVRRQYYRDLYNFERLAYETAHLFGFYPKVGEAERRWLLDKVMESDEEAAEVLIRRSFKRDVGVPSIDLVTGAMAEAYASLEVSERKEKIVLKKANETLHSNWCLTARELFDFEVSLIKEAESQDCICGAVQHSVPPINHKKELVDRLVDYLGQTPSTALFAFSSAVRHLLECDSFPPAVDLGCLNCLLTLLSKWFEWYLGARKKETIPPFTDSDLWKFVLVRHAELLKWVVSHYCSDGNKEWHMQAVEGARNVSFALIHCMEMYKAALFTRRTNSEAKRRRLSEVTHDVAEWLQRTVVNTLLGGIQQCCLAQEGPSCESGWLTDDYDLNPRPLPLIAVRVALARAQLLLLCGVRSLLMDARQLLLQAIQFGFKEMSLLAQNATTHLRADWAICMTSVLCAFRRTLQGSEKGEVAPHDVLVSLHRNYERLHSLSPISVIDIVSDSWMDFLSSCTDSFEVVDKARGNRFISVFDVTHARQGALGIQSTFVIADRQVAANTDRKRTRER